MAIKIINYCDKDVLNFSLPLIVGEILTAIDSKIIVQNETSNSESIIWPVINGRFKILVKLKIGENRIKFQHKNFVCFLHLIYEPLKCERFIRLVYIKCKDGDGTFQAPQNEDNSVNSACRRLGLAGKMLQTFTSDKLKEHNLSGKTFRLEEENDEVVCHVFTSSLSLAEAYKLNEEQLWSHFAIELMNSKLRIGNKCKFLAFLSFTRYDNNSNTPPLNHKEVLALTKGQVALGGGGLALFGSGCLHTWPESLQEIPWRFGDKRKIDRMSLMDDSANRGWYWACYSTGLGATLHELGHTFDLGHTNGGIMGRGFDDIHKYFIIDMFYHDHLFQKDHNPHFQQSSIHSHTVPLCLTSPISWKPTSSMDVSDNQPHKNDEESVDFHSEQNNNCINENSINERPWRIPNPPDRSSDEKLAVHVGGAYWTRSSALILHFHKWFNNDADSQSKGAITMKGTTLSSPNGIRVVEFRDSEGTSIGHLEYLAGVGTESVDLTQSDLLQNLSNDIKEVSFIAEDNVGNILKSKLDLENF
ncbi:putative zinc metalloproteinase-like protein [Argiope bruennichi]|uniref:Putative zinc metalloproteinase-like protein n=1 Tax=Argiope bruennichi TaxID=94029 RepID=A0A8T0FM53_ARGBR|nr:putative zinc metalloproteinase-like protein [Argiope bruennichi]